ncbi:MAG: LysE family transporter [Flavobacteriales bacterium]|jgi:threonine/homoserine/homoserine lactone efflux protein|nr:LysE family transporter [Flavobacteriales bacterium]
MTVNIIINGILFGLLLSFFFGPAFFILINTSINKGFKKALFLDIGILFSDILYLCAAYLFAEKINHYIYDNIYVKYLTGGVFFILGIIYLLKKSNPSQNTQSINLSHQNESTKNLMGLIAKGIGINAINPGVLLYWIAACTYATETLEIKEFNLVYYFMSTILTLFIVDLIKIYFASKLKSHLNNKTQNILKNILGIGLIVFGIIICLKGFNV